MKSLMFELLEKYYNACEFLYFYFQISDNFVKRMLTFQAQAENKRGMKNKTLSLGDRDFEKLETIF